MITSKEVTDLVFRHDALKENNKNYEVSLYDFLSSHGVTPNEIKCYLAKGAAGLKDGK